MCGIWRVVPPHKYTLHKLVASCDTPVTSAVPQLSAFWNIYSRIIQVRSPQRKAEKSFCVLSSLETIDPKQIFFYYTTDKTVITQNVANLSSEYVAPAFCRTVGGLLVDVTCQGHTSQCIVGNIPSLWWGFCISFLAPKLVALKNL